MAQRKGKAATGADDVVDVVEVKGSNVTSGNFFENNQKNLSYVVVAIGVLVALYFGYKYLYIGPKEKEAVNAMYKAEEQFAKDSFALALDNPGGGFEGFLGIIDSYSGTKASNLAKYYAGVCYLNIGKFQEAADYLEDYSAEDDVTSMTKAGALGDAYAELGDMDKAIKLYKEAASADNAQLSPFYLYKIAIYNFNQGNKEEAKAGFEEIRSKYPESVQSEDAEKVLFRLQ
jgi:tetratricopeptide (TPR) repeat protein